MHFLCRSFVGRDPDSWSRFWENEPDDLNLRSTKGHLFSLICLSGAPSDTLASQGRELIDQLTSIYFSPDYPDPKSAFNAISPVLSSAASGLSVSLLVISLIKNRLHISLFGECQVYLYRDLSVSQVASSQPGLPTFLSGPAKPNDLLVFGLNSFFQQFGSAELLIPPPSTASALEEYYQSRLIDFPNQSTASALIKILEDEDVLASSPPSSENLTPSPSVSDSKPELPPAPSFRPAFRFPFGLSKPVYVSTSSTFYHRSTRTVNLIIIIFVIIGFGLLLGFGYQRNLRLQNRRQTQVLIEAIETKLNQAISFKTFDPDSALALTKKAQAQLSQLKAIDPDSVKVVSLTKQIDQLAGQIGSADSFNPTLFYDATLLAPNSKYQKMLILGEQLALLDLPSGRVDLVNLQLRSKTNYYAGSDLSAFSFFWVSANRLLAGSASQISTLDSAKSTLFSFSPSAAYTAAAAWNENSYLIGPSLTDIYKFTPRTAAEFSPPKPWLVSGKLDFSPVSIAINGKIYLLGSDCRVRPYDRGSPVSFSSVSITNCRSPSSLTVNLSGDKIAFIDNQKTVYLLDEKGQIKSRFVFAEKQFLDIMLHPTLPKIYFLSSDQKIYYLDL